MPLSLWLMLGLAFLLASWRIFSRRPVTAESDEEELERLHDDEEINDDEYARRKAALAKKTAGTASPARGAP